MRRRRSVATAATSSPGRLSRMAASRPAALAWSAARSGRAGRLAIIPPTEVANWTCSAYSPWSWTFPSLTAPA